MNERLLTAVNVTTGLSDDLMNQATFILFAATLCSWNSSGQTNAPLAPVKLFSLPSPQLRPLVSADTTAAPVRSDRDENPEFRKFPAILAQRSEANVTMLDVARPESVAVFNRLGEFDVQTYRMLEANGYLKRPEPKSDNFFVRVVNGIFEPARVRIGKTTVSCSVITAIKRKNPLCLLNPLVLTVSW